MEEGGRRRVWKVGGASRQWLLVTQFTLTPDISKTKQTELHFPTATGGKVQKFMKTITNDKTLRIMQMHKDMLNNI